MLLIAVFPLLSFLNLGTDAVQKEEIPKFYRENESKKESCKCSDITPLLNKLISELEDMKGQILHEMPEQLEKQGLDIKKMANDLEIFKGMFEAQANKTDSSIAEQTKENNKIAKNLAEISENLQVRDQRLQNLSNKDFCKTSVPTPSPRDCSDIRLMGSRSSGVYRIYLNNNNIPKDVYCDFSTPGGNWLIFQRRRDGSVDFYQNWTAYANGFGNVNGEFWLGNEILYQLTSAGNRRYKLRIDLEDFENKTGFAEYATFSVGPSSDYYRLRIGSYSGNAGDSLSYHNNRQFTTHDVDRDSSSSGNCASSYHGAWWFGSCHYSDLNGRYYSRGAGSGMDDGVNWYHFGNQYRPMKTAEMKITRLD